MSTISVYFIPVNKLTSGAFKPRAIQVLEQLGLIDGYYDEEEEGFAAGQIILFEYATIYDHIIKRLVPQTSIAGYGAVCSHCDEDVDHIFYNTINDCYDAECEGGGPVDMAGLQLTCGHCNTTTTLDALKYTQTVCFENQFIQFNDLADEISPSLLGQIQMRFGTPFQLVYEHM
jgi:hypothetical protein